MNWGKVLLTGAVGGLAVWLYSFLMHGVIMANTYAQNAALFNQGGNPVSFLVVAVAVGVAGAMLFAKTRSSWDAGVKGGMMFGLFVGLVMFFNQFYPALVLNGFPYYLAWCWGGIELLGWMVFGAVASFFIK